MAAIPMKRAPAQQAAQQHDEQLPLHQDQPPVVRLVRWIMLAHYCAQTGDTPGAVHARRRKKQWIDGVHCKVDPNGNLRINPEEVDKWVESNQKSGS